MRTLRLPRSLTVNVLQSGRLTANAACEPNRQAAMNHTELRMRTPGNVDPRPASIYTSAGPA